MLCSTGHVLFYSRTLCSSKIGSIPLICDKCVISQKNLLDINEMLQIIKEMLTTN